MPTFILVFIAVMISGSLTYAESPFEARLVNFDLKQQIEAQKSQDGERTLPEWENFTLASDLILWKYWPDTSGYYHGPGFWLDTYMEYRPLSSVTLNGKLLFANGSSSYGYNAASGIKPFVGVTWTPEMNSIHWSLLIRFFDLDRTTIGSGLFFEDREMSGGFLSLRYRNWFLNLRLPGTSVLNVTGDLYSVESFFQTRVGEVGFHSFYIAEFARLEARSTGGALDLAFYNIDPVTSVFWRNGPESQWRYKFEMANLRDQYAGVVGVGYNFKTQCDFCVETFLQARHYDSGILEEMEGNASFDYIPYTLHVRDFTNAINILSEPGEAQAASLKLNMKWQLSDTFFIESLNEAGKIQYNIPNLQSQTQDFYWYRQSLGYCPYANRPRSCARFFVANKVLRVNGLERTFFQSSNIYKRADIFGFEAKIFL